MILALVGVLVAAASCVPYGTYGSYGHSEPVHHETVHHEPVKHHQPSVEHHSSCDHGYPSVHHDTVHHGSHQGWFSNLEFFKNILQFQSISFQLQLLVRHIHTMTQQSNIQTITLTIMNI